MEASTRNQLRKILTAGYQLFIIRYSSYFTQSKCCTAMKTVCMIVAGCVCNIMISAVFGTFGTYVPYVLSYLRLYDSSLKYSDIALLVALNNVAFNTLSWCSGFMINALGIKQTATLASLMLSLSTGLCYFALRNYWAFTVLTSAVSFFSAIIQATIIVVCMEWGKRHKGTAVGIISFSESIGSTLFSIIGTAVINPRNLSVDKISGYFEEPEILHRIPIYFLALGVATFIVLIPTSLVISMPQGYHDDSSFKEEEYLVEESDDIAYVRSVRSMNYDLSHASFPDYKMVRKISQSQSSYRTKPDIIIDEVYESEDDGAGSRSSSTSTDSDKESGWLQLFYSKDFYLLTIVYSVAKICRTMLMTYYKAYGLTVIPSDQFLTMIAVCSNFMNAVGRLLWGALSDRFRSKYLIIAAMIIGIGGVEATYWCLYSTHAPDILYMITICLDGVIFASQILFTTCLYTYFGKKDFGVKYGLVRAGPGLAVLGFSFLLKYVDLFDSWSMIYHSMAALCIFSALVSTFLTNHRITPLK
ncbi:hypothetical protein ACHWQZ_G008612 [Mnemiopsis leidyi]